MNRLRGRVCIRWVSVELDSAKFGWSSMALGCHLVTILLESYEMYILVSRASLVLQDTPVHLYSVHCVHAPRNDAVSGPTAVRHNDSQWGDFSTASSLREQHLSIWVAQPRPTPTQHIPPNISPDHGHVEPPVSESQCLTHIPRLHLHIYKPIPTPHPAPH
jgi:hypothetical protein